MSDSTKKPVIFISYSHKDEPESAPEGDIHWLGEIQSYLVPAANGTFQLWSDEEMAGGADWEHEIKAKLEICDICILLLSRHSLASKYIIEVEIETILERQRRGHKVQIYPIVLSPFPQSGAPPSLLTLNLRPRLDKPLSGFSRHNRGIEISTMADEIMRLLGGTGAPAATKLEAPKPPSYVHIAGLPETAYERLVGRDDELKRLHQAWSDPATNVISLVAEGGAGKSALVNEWLRRLQPDNYRGADAVLAWSFYSQGTKERATSAEQFLTWALDKLGVKLETTSATAKGEAIAEAMMRRRVLLVLDGVEPLQHGPGTQVGQLKDFGLRALLRRFAATPPGAAHGLVVLTSRLAVADIARWRDAAPVVDVERLSDEAGAALLRDNGVWGTDRELKAAAPDFGGHPLALDLVASLLRETQFGDVRRRDHIRAWDKDAENPRHDHAVRVMESYETEWLVEPRPQGVLGLLANLFRPRADSQRAVLLAIMRMVGLFDRPASGDCLAALRAAPAIGGLTDRIVTLDESAWRRAVERLREARLLSPGDPNAADALDAHPLLREWFGERLRQTNETAWKAAHGRLYEHLRDTTKEGKTPTLDDLAPLYQAVAHGCRAGRHQEALDDIYVERICRRRGDGSLAFYAAKSLGAFGSDLAALSWFFTAPYNAPIASLRTSDRAWVLNEAAARLRAQGRLAEALPALRAALRMVEDAASWENAATGAGNLSEAELLVGEVSAAIATAERSVTNADRSGKEFPMISMRATHADASHAAGRHADAARLFADAEQRQKEVRADYPLLFSVRGYLYCDLLLATGEQAAARDRATETIIIARNSNWLLDIALDTLTLGRAYVSLAVAAIKTRRRSAVPNDARTGHTMLEQAVDRLRAAANVHHIPRGLLARAAFRRNLGDWDGAVRDLDEVEEIAEPGPMRLYLCDMALERARLALARIEAFAPLNGMLERDNPPKPAAPAREQIAELKDEAGKQIAAAAKLIETCGYHRRDEELAELKAVLADEKTFAELPPRV